MSHNDLLFFRTDAEHPDQVVTMGEATTFASFMGLSGSNIGTAGCDIALNGRALVLDGGEQLVD